MFTVDLFAASEHYNQVSEVAATWAAADPPNGSGGLLSLIAFAVAAMLMAAALKKVGRLVADLWSMTRLLFTAVGAALLIIVALAVAVAALVIHALSG